MKVTFNKLARWMADCKEPGGAGICFNAAVAGVVATYFEGEKNAGLFAAALGLVVLLGAAMLFPARLELRPLAYTLAVWGVLELAVGVGLYVKTGPQVARLLAQLASDPSALHAAELPRMIRVQRNFVVLEFVWIALIVGSATVGVWFKSRFSVSAVALGILVNAALLLAFDLVAERRGAVYLAALEAEANVTSGSSSSSER